jgi:hypothetical protein
VAYFEEFLTKQPNGTINEQYVRWLNPEKDVAANSGIYTFALKDKDGKVSFVPCRFTFVYAKDAEGNWKIVEHHSSKLPSLSDPLAEVSALFSQWCVQFSS